MKSYQIISRFPRRVAQPPIECKPSLWDYLQVWVIIACAAGCVGTVVTVGVWVAMANIK